MIVYIMAMTQIELQSALSSHLGEYQQCLHPEPRHEHCMYMMCKGNTKNKFRENLDIGSQPYYNAFASHLGNLREAFISSLDKNRAYRMCSKNTKQLQFSNSRVPKMMYIVVMEGTVLNPNELNIRVIIACRLTVIKPSMFSCIKNDDVRTYPTAPNARTNVHTKIERLQFTCNLHKDPIVNPSNPCINK